jgi:hypothetical protein
MRTIGNRRVSTVLALAVAAGAVLLQAGCLEEPGDSEPAGEASSAVTEAPGSELVDQFDPGRAAAIAKAKLASIKPGESSPQFAPCGTAGSTAVSTFEADAPLNGAANQRSGSSTSCGAPGALQPTDDATYFCWTPGNDGLTWTYLENLRTHVRGWVRDDLLDNFGAPAANRCPGLG